LHDRRQIFVGQFYWQTKSANFIDRLTTPLELTVCMMWYVYSGWCEDIGGGTGGRASVLWVRWSPRCHWTSRDSSCSWRHIFSSLSV